MEIAYEPHPVTPERKAELRKAGFIIVDVRFKPQGVDAPVKTPKAALTREDVAAMKKGDVLELLEAHGIEADKGEKVADLRATLANVMFTDL